MSSDILTCLPRDESCRTPASKKYNKDCYDFKSLNDGTKTGEAKYCQHSNECQQTDIDMTGKPIPMEAHILPVINVKTGRIVEHRLLCTGKIDLRPFNERLDDKEAF